MSTKSGEGTITCINGVRVLSLTWVILGHTFLLLTMFKTGMFTNRPINQSENRIHEISNMSHLTLTSRDFSAQISSLALTSLNWNSFGKTGIYRSHNFNEYRMLLRSFCVKLWQQITANLQIKTVISFYSNRMHLYEIKIEQKYNGRILIPPYV